MYERILYTCCTKDFNFIVLLAIIPAGISILLIALFYRSFLHFYLWHNIVLLFHKYLRFCELILVYTFLCVCFFFFLLIFLWRFSLCRNNMIWFCNKFLFTVQSIKHYVVNLKHLFSITDVAVIFLVNIMRIFILCF